ncbi:MAG: sigma-54-dependent Fis family transcriptional regulator [Candidatus Omnitrophica bacterium]|nr:sigma-54-dependent Fis family transcriptional regulator [Candidatus Omnitrophota bacterium]
MNTQKTSPHVLIIDDEPSVLETFKIILEAAYTVHTAATGKEALSIIHTQPIDTVFLDIIMPDVDGIELLRKIKEYDRSIEVIMATASDSARQAVTAIKLGAFNYITKPFDVEEISTLAEKACAQRRMNRELFVLRQDRQKEGFAHIIGNSPNMKGLYRLIKKVCDNSSTVLITGESGTGKELIARAIHFNSTRAPKPFIPLNCASIPDSLLESELFGYEKGAFTGAASRKLGMFELAHEGTLFLDEISSLKLDVQAHLLRVLEEKEIKRLGGTKIFNIDVRIISATNVDLKALVDDGKFRMDLYYRLNVVPLPVPPLRDRKEDIPLLARHFLDMFNQSFRKHIEGFSKEAMDCLIEYEWPGNVRELKNIIERIAALHEKGVITPQTLPFDIFIRHNLSLDQDGGNLKEACRDFERHYIEAVLTQSSGNQTKAAKILGIHRNALFLKMKSLGLKP